MPNFFSQLWTGEEFRRFCENPDGRARALVHAASNRFHERQVSQGDFLYIWCFNRGRLLLIGRMEVDRVVDYDEARQRLQASDFSDSLTDHAIARSRTKAQADNEVPLRVIRQLAFVSPKGDVKPPKFRSSNGPDPQTFRGVRQLTPASAALLDSLL